MEKFLTLGLVLALTLFTAGCGASDTEDAALQAPAETETEDIAEAPAQPADAEGSATPEEEDSDPRGIPGMSPYAVLMTMSGSPFNIPVGESVASSDAEHYAYSRISYGEGSDPFSGVSFDYSLTLDEDEEIIGASFGVSAVGASEDTLCLAADLYFYCVGLIEYNTADSDALCAWFEESIKTAGSDGLVTTIGDATYSLYGIPGSMYWVDISKMAV